MTISQRDEARDGANQIRSSRSRIKAEIRGLTKEDGQVLLADIIEPGVPRALGSLYAFQLLMLSPRVGDAKACRILRRAGVHPLRRAAVLTERQRLALGGALRDMAACPRRAMASTPAGQDPHPSHQKSEPA